MADVADVCKYIEELERRIKKLEGGSTPSKKIDVGTVDVVGSGPPYTEYVKLGWAPSKVATSYGDVSLRPDGFVVSVSGSGDRHVLWIALG